MSELPMCAASSGARDRRQVARAAALVGHAPLGPIPSAKAE
jgi:hypothetical protein